MEQYRTYLRAELGKFRRREECQAFLASGACRVERFGLVSDAGALSQALRTQVQVDVYVDGLRDQELVELTECCGRWRHNNVAAELSPRQASQFVVAAAKDVLLNQAEPDLGRLFQRLSWRLSAIARDHDVLGAEPYRSLGPGQPIAYRTCLAKPEAGSPGTYRIFDGMHRAIQMVRNGETEIPLCVVGPAG